MRILHIAPTPFFADRGCHIRILGEIRALQQLGHEVTLVTYHLGREIPGLDVRRIPKIPWYSKLDAGFSWHKLYLDLLLSVKTFQVCLQKRPDVIHGHLHEGAAIGWLTSLFFSLRRIPVIFDMQGSLTGELQAYNGPGLLRYLLFVFGWMEKLVCRLPDYFVCSSKANADMLQRKFDQDWRKIQILREGVEDTGSLQPNDALRDELGIPGGKAVVIFTGALLEAKGLNYLLQAIPHVLRHKPNTHFVLVGYPVEQCQQNVNKAGLTQNVTLCGRVDYFQLYAYLALADVAVDPKVASTGEGSGKISNYMGAGLPVVCFDTPSNREILGNDGIFAKIADANDLAAKINLLLDDPGAARDRGARNKSRILKDFSWKTCAEKLVDIYRSQLYTNKKTDIGCPARSIHKE